MLYYFIQSYMPARACVPRDRIKEHWQNGMRLSTALVCVCCALPGVACLQYSVDCLQFYDTLATYVDCGGQCPRMQNAADCSKSGLVHTMLMYEDAIAVRNTSVVYDLRDPRQLSRLLVFASIGRHFARQPGAKTPHFKWDGYTETLVLNQMSCEFQRPLYAFILIVTLVFVIVFVAMHAAVDSSSTKPYPKDKDKDKPDATAVGFRRTLTVQQ